MNLGLVGKHALVTGGSRGIGRAIVLALARQGVSVAACYQRESEAVTSLADELSGLDGDSFVVQADISSDEDSERLVSEVQERYGSIEILVNNAGDLSRKLIEDPAPERGR